MGGGCRRLLPVLVFIWTMNHASRIRTDARGGGCGGGCVRVHSMPVLGVSSEHSPRISNKAEYSHRVATLSTVQRHLGLHSVILSLSHGSLHQETMSLCGKPSVGGRKTQSMCCASTPRGPRKRLASHQALTRIFPKHKAGTRPESWPLLVSL